MAESKLERVKQQIQNLVEMRDQLEEMLKHWNIKLARTRRGTTSATVRGLAAGD